MATEYMARRKTCVKVAGQKISTTGFTLVA